LSKAGRRAKRKSEEREKQRERERERERERDGEGELEQRLAEHTRSYQILGCKLIPKLPRSIRTSIFIFFFNLKKKENKF
jgi:hypothetical protein